jgi:hypothetical protein
VLHVFQLAIGAVVVILGLVRWGSPRPYAAPRLVLVLLVLVLAFATGVLMMPAGRVSLYR